MTDPITDLPGPTQELARMYRGTIETFELANVRLMASAATFGTATTHMRAAQHAVQRHARVRERRRDIEARWSSAGWAVVGLAAGLFIGATRLT